jgi:hypothetical protein
MSDKSESLILKERVEVEAQPFLFADEDLLKIDRAKPKFHCTGERLFRDRPDVYKAIVKMLAEPGVSIRSICATLHVTDDTVRAVKDRENLSIAAQKRTVLSNITHGLRLASERVIELMPEASARDALIGVGILGDKFQLLSGEATVRIDHGASFDVHEAIRELKEIADEADRRGRAIRQARAREIGVEEKSAEQMELTNGDREPPCSTQDGAGNAVVETPAS